jgi:PAS domain S-box-containing protein
VNAATSSKPTDFELNGTPSQVVKILSIGGPLADLYQASKQVEAKVTPRVEFTCVDRFADAFGQLTSDSFDIVLLDPSSSDPTELEVLETLRQRTPNTTVVLVSNQHPAESTMQAVLAGLADGALNTVAGTTLHRLVQNAAESYRTQQALQESEDRYRRLLRSVTSYVYTVEVQDGMPVTTRHGPGCAAATGYSPEDYAQDPYLWLWMIHPDDRELVLRHVDETLSGNRVPPIEHRIHHRDGTERWVRDTIVPHYDADGRMVEYDGVVEDITDRKLAEERLRHRESFLLAAKRIQQKFLPRRSPSLPGFDIAGAVYPAEFVAGDFFDYLRLPDGSIGIVVGDVAGHGFGPALIMAETHVTLRSLAATHVAVPEVLSLANSILFRETASEHFITPVFCASQRPGSHAEVRECGSPDGIRPRWFWAVEGIPDKYLHSNGDSRGNGFRLWESGCVGFR